MSDNYQIKMQAPRRVCSVCIDGNQYDKGEDGLFSVLAHHAEELLTMGFSHIADDLVNSVVETVDAVAGSVTKQDKKRK
jgi:hypothetical protein